MIGINTNLGSLIVQSNLKKSTNALNTAIERMTTGFKINRAKDNAANYSISTNMSSKISAYQVAEDNALMGLDMLNTAESTLDSVITHLQRIRELAEQSANGTYDMRFREAIQREVSERSNEIERLITSAQFNGRKLFESQSGLYITGDFISDVTQISEEDAIAQGYTIIRTAEDLDNIHNDLSGKYILMNDIDLSGIDWEPIGTLSNAFKGILEGNGFIIQNLYINSTSDYVGLFGCSMGGEINNLGLENSIITGNANVGGIVGAVYEQTAISNCYVTGNITGNRVVGGLVGYIQFSGAGIVDSYVNADIKGNKTIGGIAGDLKANLTNSYATGTVTGNSSVGGLGGNFQNAKIVNSYSNTSVIGTISAGAGAVVGAAPDWNTGTIINTYFNKDKNLSLDAIGSNPAGIYGGDGILSAELNNFISQSKLPIGKIPAIAPGSVITNLQVGIDSSKNSVLSFDTGLSLNINFDVYTSVSARHSLNTIDVALKKIANKQTELGSVQNRLTSVLEEISIKYDNLVSSRSTLRDADIAEESSEYIKMQILQQASATLLATANQTPSIALQLL